MTVPVGPNTQGLKECSRTRRPCKKAVLISILLHEGPLPSSNSKVLAVGFWVGLYLSIWLQGIPPRKYSAPLCKPLNPKSETLNPISNTVDQFNKKRVLLPQTLDISYSGVHGNKKFPVEGPEVVR